MRIIKTAQYIQQPPAGGMGAKKSPDELDHVGGLDLSNLHLDKKDVDVNPTDDGMQIEIDGTGHVDADPNAHDGGNMDDLLQGIGNGLEGIGDDIGGDLGGELGDLGGDLGSDLGNPGHPDDLQVSVHGDPDMDPMATEHGDHNFDFDNGTDGLSDGSDPFSDLNGMGIDIDLNGEHLGDDLGDLGGDSSHLVGDEGDDLGDLEGLEGEDDFSEFDDDAGLFGGDDLDDSLDDGTGGEHRKEHGGDGPLGGFGPNMGGFGPPQSLL